MASPRCCHCLRPAAWTCLECGEEVCAACADLHRAVEAAVEDVEGSEGGEG